MYTRQDLPPSYSGSLFRDGVEEVDTAIQTPDSTECAKEDARKNDLAEAMAEPAPAREKGVRLRLGIGRLLKINLEDLIILARLALLFLEDGEADLLPILLILFFTDR